MPSSPAVDGAATRPQAAAGGTPAVTREMLLARFIRLCGSILAATDPREAGALAVNRIGELVRTDRAVLVKLKGRNPIQAVTGGGAAAQDSAFADAVEAVRKRYGRQTDAVVVPRIRPDAASRFPHLATLQEAMGGTRILWLPLRLSNDDTIPPQFALWLERWQDRPWEPPDIELAQHAALFLGHALVPRQVVSRPKRRWRRLAVATVILVFLCLPVSTMVTAPARVIPDSPHHVFAPMDGILKELFVRPGQWVEKDKLLFRYDSRVLDKRLDEAYRNVAVAKAKLIRLQGAAHRDPDARAEVPVQKLEVARAEADVAFYAAQRDRADVRAGQAGVVVLDDPDALIGAAIQTGQAVMSVADPDKTKTRLLVPVTDAGLLEKGATVSIRLDSDPLHSLPAIITRIGFEVTLSEQQIPSVIAEAVWVDGAPEVQPGQHGSAKIYGPTTLMGFQILRKPFIHLRSIIGF